MHINFNDLFLKMQEQLDALDVKMQKGGLNGRNEEKSFNENLSEIIREKADELKREYMRKYRRPDGSLPNEE